VPPDAGKSDAVPALELAVLVGLPGAGKTSFYRARLAGTHVHVSKDVLGHGRDTGRRQLELTAQALRRGQSVAVDNTNPRAEDRAPLIALARAAGARVVSYVLQTPTREAAARNRAREGAARVPNVAVFATAKRLQPPTAAEGFDAVYGVRAEGGDFAIEAAALESTAETGYNRRQ
jgi:predicted kinase